MMHVLDNPYYALKQIPPVADGAALKGVVAISRKDTGEPVTRVIEYGRDEDELAKRLQDAVRERLVQLGRPNGWGKDPTVAQLITRFLENRDFLYGIELRAEAASSGEEASRIRADGIGMQALLDRDLRARVAALTPDQRLELASATDEQLAQGEDGRMLDILTAKRDLARWLPSPSPRERAELRRLERWFNGDPASDSVSRDSPVA